MHGVFPHHLPLQEARPHPHPFLDSEVREMRSEMNENELQTGVLIS